MFTEEALEARGFILHANYFDVHGNSCADVCFAENDPRFVKQLDVATKNLSGQPAQGTRVTFKLNGKVRTEDDTSSRVFFAKEIAAGDYPPYFTMVLCTRMFHLREKDGGEFEPVEA